MKCVRISDVCALYDENCSCDGRYGVYLLKKNSSSGSAMKNWIEAHPKWVRHFPVCVRAFVSRANAIALCRNAIASDLVMCVSARDPMYSARQCFEKS